MYETKIIATITFDLTVTTDQPITIPAKCVVTGAGISDVVGTPANASQVNVRNGALTVAVAKPTYPGYSAVDTKPSAPAPIIVSGVLTAKNITPGGTSCQLHIIGFEVP